MKTEEIVLDAATLIAHLIKHFGVMGEVTGDTRSKEFHKKLVKAYETLREIHEQVKEK